MKRTDPYWEIALSRFQSYEACDQCRHGGLYGKCPNSEPARAIAGGTCPVSDCKHNSDGVCSHHWYPLNTNVEDLVLEDL